MRSADVDIAMQGGGCAGLSLAARLTRHAGRRSTYCEAVFKVVFIGLAALTVPHMILIDRLHRSWLIGEKDLSLR